MKASKENDKNLDTQPQATGLLSIFKLKPGSLKLQIVRSFLIIAIALIILGLINLYSLRTMENKFNFVVEHDAVVIENARHMEKLVVDMETGQRGYIITGKMNFLEPYSKGVKTFNKLIKEEIELVSDNPKQVTRLNHINQLVEEWKRKAAIPEINLARKYHEGLINIEQNKSSSVRMTDVAVLLQKSTGKNILDEIRIKFKVFIDEELLLTEIRHKDASTTSTNTKSISIFIIIFGGIGALLIGIRLANSISKPILRLKNSAIEIAQGNLDHEVKTQRIDEVGQLGVQMEIMRANLQHTLNELTDYKYAIDETAIIAITDNKGTITYANKQFSEISKYSIDELVGQNHSILNSGHHSKEFFKKMWAQIGSGNTFQADMKNKKKDGSFYWINNTIIPFMNNKGKPYQYVAIKRDITDSKIFNITLENLVEKLKLAKENQSQFLSNMSHEIRTPMNGILGMTRLLQKTILDKEQEKYSNAIFTSANNLMVIINEILDFSKIEAGKLTIEQISFNINEQVTIWNETLKVSSNQKKIDFEINVNKEVPTHLIGDPIRLSQIIYNLGGNAIKFTEKGKVSINIYLKDKKSNAITLQVDVIDNGIGIHVDKQDTIFSSFSQASSNTTRKYGGTGLGLTITKQLIELQNGNIWVESEEGKGSTFSFVIPYKIAIKTQEEEELKDEFSQKKLKEIKVLLVEDHDINQLLATTVLEQWNFKVDLAEDGIEAVEKVKENSYDIILMDIHMPKMDGYQATKEIRNTLKDNTPIIALTASARISDNQLCYDVGMNDFISKPFDPEVLLQKINIQVNKKLA